MKDDFLVPKKWKSDIRKTFDTNDKALSRKFDLYAENVCKNTGLKNYLSEKQNNKCAWCGESLEDNSKGYGVIHHADYDNFCTGPTYTWYKDGEEKEVPNCLGCSFKNMCTSNLYIVHSKCNKEINDVQLKNYRGYKEKEDVEYHKSNMTCSEEIYNSNDILNSSEILDIVRNSRIIKKDGEFCPNIYNDWRYTAIKTSFGKVRISEKDWYSVKEDSFELFLDDYRSEALQEATNVISFLYGTTRGIFSPGEVIKEKKERYYTLETLHNNVENMLLYLPIDSVEYCKAYNNSKSLSADRIISANELPFLYCKDYKPDFSQRCIYECRLSPGEPLSCVYNLQTFDILPLSLPRNEIFEFRDIGNKKGQCKIYICKEWYDDPEIKKAFDGYVMTQTNTKKILQYPEVIDEHSWIEEYLNPSAV